MKHELIAKDYALYVVQHFASMQTWSKEEIIGEILRKIGESKEDVVRCRDCVHAIEIERPYIKSLFIDGTRECDIGRGDLCYGASIASLNGFCDSGERRSGDA